MEYELILRMIRDRFGAGEGDFVPLHAPTFSGNEKKYLDECIDSTFVSSVGAFVDRFERDIAEYTGARNNISRQIRSEGNTAMSIVSTQSAETPAHNQSPPGHPEASGKDSLRLRLPESPQPQAQQVALPLSAQDAVYRRFSACNTCRYPPTIDIAVFPSDRICRDILFCNVA